MVMTSLSGHLLNMEFGLQYRKWLVGQDRTERDGTGRDGTGRDGTGRFASFCLSQSYP